MTDIKSNSDDPFYPDMAGYHQPPHPQNHPSSGQDCEASLAAPFYNFDFRDKDEADLLVFSRQLSGHTQLHGPENLMSEKGQNIDHVVGDLSIVLVLARRHRDKHTADCRSNKDRDCIFLTLSRPATVPYPTRPDPS